MHFLKLFKLGKQWKSKMNLDRVETEQKQLIELQNVSEKISDYISKRNFESIISLEKQRLKIYQTCFTISRIWRPAMELWSYSF